MYVTMTAGYTKWGGPLCYIHANVTFVMYFFCFGSWELSFVGYPSINLARLILYFTLVQVDGFMEIEHMQAHRTQHGRVSYLLFVRNGWHVDLPTPNREETKTATHITLLHIYQYMSYWCPLYTEQEWQSAFVIFIRWVFKTTMIRSNMASGNG